MIPYVDWFLNRVTLIFIMLLISVKTTLGIFFSSHAFRSAIAPHLIFDPFSLGPLGPVGQYLEPGY